MSKPISVQFRGGKSQLQALVTAKILNPKIISGRLVLSLSDIQNLYERVLELEAIVESIREMVNDETCDD